MFSLGIYTVIPFHEFDPFFRAANICDTYPNYIVRFHGVGPGPRAFENGHHTQVAIFLRSRSDSLEDVRRRGSDELAVPSSSHSEGVCTHKQRAEIYKPLRTIGTTIEFSHFTHIRNTPELVALTLRQENLILDYLFYRRFVLPNIKAKPVISLMCPDEETYTTVDVFR